MALLTPETVFRRYETDGAPDSGDHKPIKAEIIQLLNMLFGVSRGGWVVARTLAELNGITPESETDGGVVLTGMGAGYYDRNAGAWIFGRGFPDTFAKVLLAGSGTAQTGVVEAGVNPASIEVFFAKVVKANTGALTLSISGEAAKPVVNIAGNPLSAGEWTGMVMFYLNEDGEYQLLIDAGAAASAAASATLSGQRADDAEAAAVRAENAAASFSEVGTNFKSVASLLADETLVYVGSGSDIVVAAGDVVSAQGFRYEVTSSGSVDFDLETAGGVKLLALAVNGNAWLPDQFAAPIDGVTDATPQLLKLASRVQKHQIVDLAWRQYAITKPLAFAATATRVKVMNGALYLTTTKRFCYALVPRDYATIERVMFSGDGSTGTAPGTEKYHGGVFGGATSYVGADFEVGLAQEPAEHVTVHDCWFSGLTIGIWCGGASADGEVFGWRIKFNTFTNIVGLSGASEGYGVTMSQSSDYIVMGCLFDGIKRHAFYHGSYGQRWQCINNIIRNVDNIAIQVNVFYTQDYAQKYLIADNIIDGVSRSIDYGYTSAVGIGIYGKTRDFIVSRNVIRNALQIGIDVVPVGADSVSYGFDANLIENDILMPTGGTGAVAAIQYLGLSGKVDRNKLFVQTAIYGLSVGGSLSTSAQEISIRGNAFGTGNGSAVAVRMAVSAARVVNVFDNSFTGFAAGNEALDTSTAGIIRGDVNQGVGFYGSDANATHRAKALTGSINKPAVRLASWTAARDITLAASAMGDEVTLVNTTSFNAVVKSAGGATIATLATGQTGRFGVNGNGAWELLMRGTT